MKPDTNPHPTAEEICDFIEREFGARFNIPAIYAAVRSGDERARIILEEMAKVAIREWPREVAKKAILDDLFSPKEVRIEMGQRVGCSDLLALCVDTSRSRKARKGGPNRAARRKAAAEARARRYPHIPTAKVNFGLDGAWIEITDATPDAEGGAA